MDIRANTARAVQYSTDDFQPSIRSRRLMQVDRKWNFYRSGLKSKQRCIFGNRFSLKILRRKSVDIRAISRVGKWKFYRRGSK